MLTILPRTPSVQALSTTGRAVGREISRMPQLPPRRFQSTATPSFTYRLAAASASKHTPLRNPKYQRDFWAYASTDPSPSPPYLRSTKPDSGEDAFFATTVGGTSHHVAFGVADGVGGWQDQGVDPSEFSHGLCGYMAGTAHLHDLAEHGALKPQSLLQTAYDAVTANPRILAGGSTACLAVVDQNGTMESANLGDSGFLIFGPGKVAYKSEVQTHAFNTPFQMAKLPKQMAAQYAIFGGESKHFSERPSQAEVVRQSLKHGDVVVFATDGVWDNLSAQDTLGIVTKVMMDTGYWMTEHKETTVDSKRVSDIPLKIRGTKEETGYIPALLAAAIMREAKIAGLDHRRDGPFAREVNARFPGEGWRGGKADDIAVVVCMAVDARVNSKTSAESEEKLETPIKAKL